MGPCAVPIQEAAMRFFELDIDEDQVRRLVKSIIDRYEAGLYTYGTYQKSVEAAQDETIQSLENAAELCETPGLLH